MGKDALQACVDRHLEHAAMVFVLDDELGTHHGLSWADFVLLTVRRVPCNGVHACPRRCAVTVRSRSRWSAARGR